MDLSLKSEVLVLHHTHFLKQYTAEKNNQVPRYLNAS